MQEALKKSQGGILEESVVDHLMLNYNRGEIALRERKAVDGMLSFSRRWTPEERGEIKLSSLPTDEIPKRVYSYFTNWSENIAEDASCRCGFQISVSDITVQHLTVYFAHRGGKGNLGKKRKKRSAEDCAKISKAKMGKKHSAEHRAKISEAKKGKGNLGKKRSAATRAKISKAKMGKKLSADHRAKISKAKKGKRRTTGNLQATEI
jgi:hypothetical protein